MFCVSATSQFAAAGQCRQSVSVVSVYATYATYATCATYARHATKPLSPCGRGVWGEGIRATYATIRSKPSLPACKLSLYPSRKWENL